MPRRTSVSVSRVIPAAAPVVFGIIATPAAHADLDGSRRMAPAMSTTLARLAAAAGRLPRRA
ncbi:hypothetical protein [Marinactinospora rubrisoli]|uniref:Uncharacterized protein n=1 Tax=Marinactinospora rubrisoli TaxID=2715399 RepID=A0ABW2KLE5_9ACTN